VVGVWVGGVGLIGFGFGGCVADFFGSGHVAEGSVHWANSDGAWDCGYHSRWAVYLASRMGIWDGLLGKVSESYRAESAGRVRGLV